MRTILLFLHHANSRLRLRLLRRSPYRSPASQPGRNPHAAVHSTVVASALVRSTNNLGMEFVALPPGFGTAPSDPAPFLAPAGA